jgi:hypothetical protein
MVWGAAVVLVLAAAMVFVFRHKIADHLVLVGEERAIANHTATPVDLTGNFIASANYFDFLEHLHKLYSVLGM